MKLTTIFLLAATLILCYCWTADGHKKTGKRYNMRALQRNRYKGHHSDMMGTNLAERRLCDCISVLRNPQDLQRVRRHMKEHHKRKLRGRRCHCKKLNRNSEISIPLS